MYGIIILIVFNMEKEIDKIETSIWEEIIR
jgi:hypothetical protein